MGGIPVRIVAFRERSIVVGLDLLTLGVGVLDHRHAADFGRVALLLHDIAFGFVRKRVAFIFRGRGNLEAGKLRLDLAIEQNLLPLAADPLVLDLG